MSFQVCSDVLFRATVMAYLWPGSRSGSADRRGASGLDRRTGMGVFWIGERALVVYLSENNIYFNLNFALPQRRLVALLLYLLVLFLFLSMGVVFSSGGRIGPFMVNFVGQCYCICARARARVCVCVWTNASGAINYLWRTPTCSSWLSNCWIRYNKNIVRRV